MFSGRGGGVLGSLEVSVMLIEMKEVVTVSRLSSESKVSSPSSEEPSVSEEEDSVLYWNETEVSMNA